MRYPAKTSETVTGIVVHYNTPEFLKVAVDSITRLYDINIIIVDGSPKASPPYNMAEHLTENKPQLKCIHVEHNIGHGKGIALGMSMVTTPLAMIFDSDINMLKPCIADMVALMEQSAERKYGIGQVMKVNYNGVNDDKGELDYLHPHFCLIDRNMYYRFRGAVHHGAPMIHAMRDMKGLDLLINFAVKDFVFHSGRATVRLKPREFKPQTWIR